MSFDAGVYAYTQTGRHSRALCDGDGSSKHIRGALGTYLTFLWELAEGSLAFYDKVLLRREIVEVGGVVGAYLTLAFREIG